MPVVHREPDWFLPVHFVRLLGNQPAPIVLGSRPTPGLTSVETTQSEPNGTVTLALMSVMSTMFVGLSIIDFPNLVSTYNGGWCTAIY